MKYFGLNPFFIRSVCGSWVLDWKFESVDVLIPSSSGQSVVPARDLSFYFDIRLNPFFIRSVCGSGTESR